MILRNYSVTKGKSTYLRLKICTSSCGKYWREGHYVESPISIDIQNCICSSNLRMFPGLIRTLSCIHLDSDIPLDFLPFLTHDSYLGQNCSRKFVCECPWRLHRTFIESRTHCEKWFEAKFSSDRYRSMSSRMLANLALYFLQYHYYQIIIEQKSLCHRLSRIYTSLRSVYKLLCF